MSNNNLDTSELYIKELSKMIINLYKLCFEEMGYDLGNTNNDVEYHNYLASDPIYFYTDDESTYEYDDIYDLMSLMGSDPGETGISDGMLTFICKHETGHEYGYIMSLKDLNGYDMGDAGGHKTYGYGLLYHPINQKFMDTIKSTWSQQELENLFKTHIKLISNKIDTWAQRNKVRLNQNQKDAIVSACYNFGIGFLNKNICKMILKNPNDPNIKNMWAHLSDAQGKKYPGLIKRRHEEAIWYFG